MEAGGIRTKSVILWLAALRRSCPEGAETAIGIERSGRRQGRSWPMTRAATQSIGGELRLRRDGLRSNAPERTSFPGRNFASLQIISIRRTQDLADDSEDFGSCVDAIELVSH
jgi:hypothetical protein